MPIAKRKDNPLNNYKKKRLKDFLFEAFSFAVHLGRKFLHGYSCCVLPNNTFTLSNGFHLATKQEFFALFNGIFNLYYIFIFIGAEAMYRNKTYFQEFFN